MINVNEIYDIEIDGVDTRDYPDFCDAYILSASYRDRALTDKELDYINDEERDFVYEEVIKAVF